MFASYNRCVYNFTGGTGPSRGEQDICTPARIRIILPVTSNARCACCAQHSEYPERDRFLSSNTGSGPRFIHSLKKEQPVSPDKLILNCSQCGGRLEVTEDIELFKCEYCGMPYMVERSGGTVQIIELRQRLGALEEGVSALSEIDSIVAQREQLEAELSSGGVPALPLAILGFVCFIVPMAFLESSDVIHTEVLMPLIFVGALVGAFVWMWRSIQGTARKKQALEAIKKREAKLLAKISQISKQTQ